MLALATRTAGPALAAGPGSASPLRAAGSPSGAQLLSGWAPTLPAGTGPVSYTTASPAAAQAQMTGGTIDFTVGDSADPAPAGIRQAPLAVTGTAVVVTATDTMTHRPVSGLRLDAATLAALYTGHPANAATQLQALNPTVHLPARLVGLTLGADREQTRRLSRWLSASPTGWTAEVEDQLPASPPPGVQLVADDTTLTGLLTSPPAAGTAYLGYLDIASAAAAGLPAAALADPSGQFTGPTPAALAAAAAAGTTPPPPGGYPLAGLDTITIPGAPTPTVAGALAALLGYAAGPGQALLPAGLPPLPGPLAARTAALSAQSQAAAQPPTLPAAGRVSHPAPPAAGTAHPAPAPAPVPPPGRPGTG